MKLSTREDIEAPIDFVFARVTDFAAFEKLALRQGAQVSRRDTGPATTGSTWDVAFHFRGRERRVVATLVQIDAPQVMVLEGTLDGLTAVTQFDLVALSPARTRLLVSFDLRAGSLTARVFLQSLKLAKVKLAKRFKARVLDFAEDIEDRFQRGQT